MFKFNKQAAGLGSVSRTPVDSDVLQEWFYSKSGRLFNMSNYVFDVKRAVITVVQPEHLWMARIHYGLPYKPKIQKVSYLISFPKVCSANRRGTISQKMKTPSFRTCAECALIKYTMIWRGRERKKQKKTAAGCERWQLGFWELRKTACENQSI